MVALHDRRGQEQQRAVLETAPQCRVVPHWGMKDIIGPE